MARFNYEQSENYAGSGNTFFTLKDDKATAKVRFLLNDLNDMIGVTCHEIKVNDKRLDVECLRNYDEPVSKCPLCAAGQKPSPKLYVPLYNEDTKTSQVWVRGRTFFDTLSGLCARYNPLVGTVFEIERNGKAGDTSTRYQIYPGRSDDAKITDFPEIIAEGSAFETKTYDELANFVDTGVFDTKSGRSNHASNERQVPVRRRPINSEEDNF